MLRRAIELAEAATPPEEGFTVVTLAAVAAELDLPPSALAAALAEHRVGADATRARSVLDRVFGPGVVAVRERSDLPGDTAQETMRAVLRRRHLLETAVDPDGTVVARPRRGMVTALTRGVRTVSGRSSGLDRVREVKGAAVTAPTGETAVCLTADVRDQRVQAIAAGSAVAATGAAAVSAVALVATAPVALVGLPVAVAGGWAVSRTTHWYRVRRVTDEVTATAGQVASGQTPTTLLDRVLGQSAPRPSPPAGPVSPA
ncbi:MAG: hypothetical protein ACK5PP_19595 [Acidimicrobiales bacterium]